MPGDVCYKNALAAGECSADETFHPFAHDAPGGGLQELSSYCHDPGSAGTAVSLFRRYVIFAGQTPVCHPGMIPYDNALNRTSEPNAVLAAGGSGRIQQGHQVLGSLQDLFVSVRTGLS